jgi:hypothetical protein
MKILITKSSDIELNCVDVRCEKNAKCILGWPLKGQCHETFDFRKCAEIFAGQVHHWSGSKWKRFHYFFWTPLYSRVSI